MSDAPVGTAVPLAVIHAKADPARLAARRAKRERRAALIPEPVGVENEITFFFRLIKKCRDPEDLGALARAVGGELAPHQLKRLYQRIAELCPPETTQVFRTKAPGWMLFQRGEPPRFQNTRLSSHARFFEAEGAARSAKVLLVLFSGRRGEAFMPISRLLARLPAQRFDVLRLRADQEGEYPCGVPGIGDSFFAVCEALRQRAAAYAGTVAIGTSLGGFSALRAAVLAGLPVGLSLAGRFTKFDPEATALDVAAYDPLCPCTPRPACRILAYFSVQNEIDTLNAEMLRTMYPNAELFPVTDSEDHNVMAQLAATGQLDRLFAELDGMARSRG